MKDSLDSLYSNNNNIMPILNSVLLVLLCLCLLVHWVPSYMLDLYNYRSVGCQLVPPIISLSRLKVNKWTVFL